MMFLKSNRYFRIETAVGLIWAQLALALLNQPATGRALLTVSLHALLVRSGI